LSVLLQVIPQGFKTLLWVCRDLGLSKCRSNPEGILFLKGFISIVVRKGQKMDFAFFPVIFVNDDAQIPSLILVLCVDNGSNLCLLDSAVLFQHVNMLIKVDFGPDFLSSQEILLLFERFSALIFAFVYDFLNVLQLRIYLVPDRLLFLIVNIELKEVS
jgi:hypothetical protein